MILCGMGPVGILFPDNLDVHPYVLMKVPFHGAQTGSLDHRTLILLREIRRHINPEPDNGYSSFFPVIFHLLCQPHLIGTYIPLITEIFHVDACTCSK